MYKNQKQSIFLCDIRYHARESSTVLGFHLSKTIYNIFFICVVLLIFFIQSVLSKWIYEKIHARRVKKCQEWENGGMDSTCFQLYLNNHIVLWCASVYNEHRQRTYTLPKFVWNDFHVASEPTAVTTNTSHINTSLHATYCSRMYFYLSSACRNCICYTWKYD